MPRDHLVETLQLLRRECDTDLLCANARVPPPVFFSPKRVVDGALADPELRGQSRMRYTLQAFPNDLPTLLGGQSAP